MKKHLFYLLILTIFVSSCAQSSTSTGVFSSSNDTSSINHSSILSSNSQNYDELFSFTLLENNTYAIRAKNNIITGDLIIPEYYHGLRVTEISERGFYNCSNIDSITLSNNLVSIKKEAFYSTGKTNHLIIPDNVEELGSLCFSCSKIKELTIGEGITTISSGAFDNAEIEAIHLGKNVKAIEKNAFNFNKFSSISLGDKVEELNPQAFGQISTFKEFAVDSKNPYFMAIDGVLYTKDMKKLVCFPYDKEVKDFKVPEGVETIGSYSCTYCPKLTGDFSFSSTVETVEDYALCEIKGLKSIILNEGLETMGRCCISCLNVHTIHLPASLKQIQEDTNMSFCGFGDANYTMTIDPNNQSYIIFNNALYTKDYKKLIMCFEHEAEDYYFHDETSTSAQSSFTNIRSNSIKRIITNDKLQFFNSIVRSIDLNRLEEIIFNESLSYILGFQDARSLKTVIIPSGINEISNNFFYDCISLSSLTLSASINTIGKYAFHNNKALTSLTFLGTVEQWDAIEKDSEASDKRIIVVCSNGQRELVPQP